MKTFAASSEDLVTKTYISGVAEHRLKELRVAAAIIKDRDDLLQTRFSDAEGPDVTLLDVAFRSGCFEIAVELARRGIPLSSFGRK